MIMICNLYTYIYKHLDKQAFQRLQIEVTDWLQIIMCNRK